MANATFKAKPETIFNHDGTPAYRRVKVPALERRHCDMAAFRSHAKFGAYANSDLFVGLLRRQLKEAGIGAYIRLDQLPPCVTVDESSFLVSVTIRFH